MTTDNTDTGSTGQPEGQKDSVFDNLREPFQAWLNAGSRLGDVVSDFADRFRDDRENGDREAGAHARHSAVNEEESTLGRFRAATKEAREKLTDAKGADGLKEATSDFAGHAEDIIRDVAGSVRRAAGGTKDSDAVEEARTAFSAAVSSVRASFDETVEGLRQRRGSQDEDADSMIADLRRRLDDLIARAGTIGAGDEKDTSATLATDPDVDPDIIEGEVLSEDSNRPDPDKDN